MSARFANVGQATTVTVVAPVVHSSTRLPHDGLISVRLSSDGGFQNGMVSLITDDAGLDRMIDALTTARAELHDPTTPLVVVR